MSKYIDLELLKSDFSKMTEEELDSVRLDALREIYSSSTRINSKPDNLIAIADAMIVMAGLQLIVQKIEFEINFTKEGE